VIENESKTSVIGSEFPNNDNLVSNTLSCKGAVPPNLNMNMNINSLSENIVTDTLSLKGAVPPNLNIEETTAHMSNNCVDEHVDYCATTCISEDKNVTDVIHIPGEDTNVKVFDDEIEVEFIDEQRDINLECIDVQRDINLECIDIDFSKI
jgi:hypothetical protein